MIRKICGFHRSASPNRTCATLDRDGQRLLRFYSKAERDDSPLSTRKGFTGQAFLTSSLSWGGLSVFDSPDNLSRAAAARAWQPPLASSLVELDAALDAHAERLPERCDVLIERVEIERTPELVAAAGENSEAVATRSNEAVGSYVITVT